ncbi:hypothetical protein GA597_05910 [Staphylococcus haemolyticus]|uniref:hypothetical protein n=1 Tax=Staphylococcus phage IME-SA4 TaxID=1610872 RepID=UPI0005D89A7D|nr:hypothetical protein [Staphylococcus haemolyticus]YP_009219673.1 hypothetical protein AVT66_gp45 [Staphylococcus phage IME-SA4]AJT61526.1 hypothetical protein IME_045 [Staphylococcus phage IME-SA4]MBK3950201.1 hypothetical protein [Staphylococcus haemolyticus]MBO1278758.1 hypothetical protein [Staphylococcus haemolyticus]QFR06364.1 hypothetical protein GA597_05910 [Staphylococcus haemolyticus]QFU26158.1 hypothetical protein D5R78_003895 [Staphylococcus haemolyticus]
MVKIKRKVEMTLPELIEWGFKNGIKNKEFVSNFFEKKSVIFNLSGWAEFSDEYAYLPEDTFTVEVEEEITKETKLPKFLEISFDRKSGRDFAVVREKESIKNIVDKNIEHFIDTRTIHLFDDDGTHTLIWKYGELVGDEQCLN